MASEIDWDSEEIVGARRTASELMQDDMIELMEALGISTHARPVSPHRVMQDEILPAVREMRIRAKQTSVREADPIELDWEIGG